MRLLTTVIINQAEIKGEIKSLQTKLDSLETKLQGVETEMKTLKGQNWTLILGVVVAILNSVFRIFPISTP